MALSFKNADGDPGSRPSAELCTEGRAVGVGSCGDRIEMIIRLREGIIAEIGYSTKGCVYTVSCTTAVSSLARGRTLNQALQLQPEDVERELGGLPEDHRHCARLAVNTLGEAIADTYRQPPRKQALSTERG